MSLVVANWKMHKTAPEVEEFCRRFPEEIAGLSGVDIVLAPAFPFLSAARDPEARWSVAGQNCSAEPSGAFTGEVSAGMLASAGCAYVLVGHSERRRYFGEEDVVLGFKVERARQAGLVPIFCVGETLHERDAGLTDEVLDRQLSALDEDLLEAPLVVAYEPVWAIGTGHNATPEQAGEALARICRRLSKRSDLRTIYGGSVTPENAEFLIEQRRIEGFLVGGSSLDPQSFAVICRRSTRRAPA
jgi:triosephosphate isomerase